MRYISRWTDIGIRIMLLVAVCCMPLNAFAQDSSQPQTIQLVASLLSDGQMVYGPNAYDFDLYSYLEEKDSPLLQYYDVLGNYALEVSINPRVLLTLLEIQYGAVRGISSEQPPWSDAFTLHIIVEDLVEPILQAYYDRLTELATTSIASTRTVTITLADGTTLALPPETNAATYALLYGTGLRAMKDEVTTFSGTSTLGGFVQTYKQLFPENDPLDNSNVIDILATPPSNLLQFPFPTGEEWWFNSPHSNLGNGNSIKSSIDFAKQVSNWDTETGSYWVVAAAKGDVTVTSSCGMVVTHTGSDNWSTSYFHLENIQVKKGSVEKNSRLANYANTYKEATCVKDSHSTMPHVHFSLRYNGALVSLHDVTLSGWKIYAQNTKDYEGSCNLANLYRGEQKRCPYSSVRNGGTAQQPPNRNPHTPSPEQPDNNYKARDGRSPTVCWSKPGDPDGDRVEFYVEVYDSPRSASKGWFSDDCWRFGELDGHYHTYKWRVKARDSRGAESSWSNTRQFTIEPENRPPSIDFQTANGNSAGSINSRDQNWTFRGTASDSEGKLQKLEFHCDGDSCDGTQTLSASNNWSYTRNGLTGRNKIWFRACDDRQCTDSRKVELVIDLAAPTTTADANGQVNPTGWFRETVNVKLRAQDGATGNASVGVREVRYRVDSGSWQSHSGSEKTVSVTGDGTHKVEYYAIDHLDNQEAIRAITFKIDATPPTAPGGVSETHGVANNQWQKTQGVPEFTWAASSDATSGLQRYELYFGNDANGEDIQVFVEAAATRRWIPLPGGARTGTYYLRGRTRDQAGNYSAWTTLFTFRYDVTAPANPVSVQEANNIPNDTWQRTTRTPNFTWPPATDEGSGIKGYLLYWGTEATGTSTTLNSGPAFSSATALCNATAICTGYLRVRSVDNVDNQASEWSTIYSLRYDGVPPTLDFSFNGGVTETAQTLVTINLEAADQGSGLREMRFSNDGVNWTAWEAFANERVWQIPAIGRQSWPIYAQVRDAVGWESPIVQHDVYFEVNRKQPRSEGFRLFDYAMSAGSGELSSSSYRANSTVGEVVESGASTSTHYQLVGGYQAGSQAIPLVVPSHDESGYINSIFASSVVVDTMSSSSYSLIGTLGEPGLPNNVTTLASSQFQHQPGFLAAKPAQQGAPSVPTPVPGPTPIPEPEPACEFPTVSINNGATFTNKLQVKLNLCAPHAEEMMISNDGGFQGIQWQPYATSKDWTLITQGQHVLPRYVYLAFKDDDGTIHSVYLDDIIYDPTAPDGRIVIGEPAASFAMAESVASISDNMSAMANGESLYVEGEVAYVVRNSADGALAVPMVSAQDSAGIQVYLVAQDDNSGLVSMQMSENENFTSAAWQPYAGLVEWTPSPSDGDKTLYARFRDSAGNVSDATQSDFIIDSTAPTGSINITEVVVAGDATVVHLLIDAADAASGLDAMRLSTETTFANAPWQPIAKSVLWPITAEEYEWEGIIFVQFRDKIGNVSESYYDSFIVDRDGPVLEIEIEPGEGMERVVHVSAYDSLSSIDTMLVSNDPLMNQGVEEMPYAETIQWTFDERQVVWIQVEDSAGNLSEMYPAYSGTQQAPSMPRTFLPYVNNTSITSGQVSPSRVYLPEVGQDE